MNDNNKKKYIWKDIGYVVIADYRKFCIDFMAYEIVAYTQDKNKKFTVIEYERKEAANGMDTTKNVENAQPAIDATIKWDACSHVDFGDDTGYLHICGGANWKNFIELQKRIFFLARDYFQEEHQKEFFDEYFGDGEMSDYPVK